MRNLEFRQVTELDAENLNRMIDWSYNWWGKEDDYSREWVACFMEHCFQKDRLPQTYGLFHEGRIVGMFQFIYEDLSVRPDLYPWLANVYVDEEYRGQGIGRELLSHIAEAACKAITKHDEIYLYTTHVGLYEKFGWEFAGEIDTYGKKPRVQRLYRLSLRDHGLHK